MSSSTGTSEALRILGHFWLEEVRPDDLETIAALPEFAQTLPQAGAAMLTELAVEYQRLFGFNLPPYESVFIDPSVMLLAPATARVQALYQQAGWIPPAKVRAGAPDHLGLELLALAEWQGAAGLKREQAARQLQTKHLALWAPAFMLSLRRLSPHPFYALLGELTLDLLLSTLPPPLEPAKPLGETKPPPDPFPILPPPPVYRDSETRSDFNPPASAEGEAPSGWRDGVKRLLVPRESGLFITREDMARLSRSLDLPAVMGERAYMLETLFRLAGQYDLVPALLNQIRQLLIETDATYRAWAADYPFWTPYAQAWCRRVAAAQTLTAKLEETVWG